MTAKDSVPATTAPATRDVTVPRRCPSCGAPNTTNTLRCRFCSTPLFDRGRCTVCRETVDPGLEICSSCGSSLSLFPPEPLPPAPPPSPRWQRHALSTALIFGLLALAVSVVVVVVSHGKVWGPFVGLTFVVVFLGMLWLSRWANQTADEDGVIPSAATLGHNG